VTTPQNPEDEPVGDELPDDAGDGLKDDVGGVSAEDALWRSIVDNYGDRPEMDEPEIEVPPSPRDLTASPRPTGVEQTEPADTADPEEHYIPPEPPPMPTPPPARLLAWTGLFGVPAFVLVALVAGLALPSWVGLLLMVWFVGGFVFLVASMGPGDGEDYDDGARL